MYEMLNKVEKPENPESTYDNVVFVDHLSQTIGDKIVLQLQQNIQSLYETTVRYFMINRLSMNSSKTEVLFVPYGNEEAPKVYLMTH